MSDIVFSGSLKAGLKAIRNLGDIQDRFRGFLIRDSTNGISSVNFHSTLSRLYKKEKGGVTEVFNFRSPDME